MAGNYGIDVKKWTEENAKRLADVQKYQANADRELKKRTEAIQKYIEARKKGDEEEKKRVRFQSLREASRVKAQENYQREQLKTLKEENAELDNKKKLFDKFAKNSVTLAETVSKGIGAEEAYKREVQVRATKEIRSDRNMVSAYKYGSDEDKTVIMEQMMGKIIEQMKLASPETFKNDEPIILNAIETLSNSFEDLVASSNNVLWPLIQTLKHTGERLQKGLQTLPLIGRMFTDEMMEHYRSAWGDFQNVMNQHLSSILAPIEMLVGPLKALGKGLFIGLKALFTGPTAYEKSVVHYLRKIAGAFKKGEDTGKKNWRERLKIWKDEKIFRAKMLLTGVRDYLINKAMWLWEKRKWLQEKKDKIKEAARAFYGKTKSGIMAIFDKLITLGPILLAAFSTFATWVTATLIPMLPVILAVTLALVVAGKAIYNIFKDWDKLGELFKAGDWSGLIRLLVADIGEALLMISEFFYNQIFEFLGMDFRFDFSKENILKMWDSMQEWLFTNITEPIMDFFTITLPNVFESIGKGLSKLFNALNPVNIGIQIWDWIVEKLAGALDSSSIPGTGSLAESLRGMKSEGSTDAGLPTTKSVASSPSTTGSATAQARAVKEQVEVQKQVRQKLDQTNAGMTENNKTQQQLIQQINTTTTVEKREIPDEVESMGVMFTNKSWGMG